MAKKKTPTISQEAALAEAMRLMGDLKAQYPDTRTNEQAVLDDYYDRQWAKKGLKNISNQLAANSGIGPNQQSMFDLMLTKGRTDYLKGVKNPSQLAGITKPNYVPPASNASSSNTSGVTSGGASSAPLPTSPAAAPSYVGSNEWEDIVDHYFPKGAGNYRDGGKVNRSNPAQTYASGGLVRGGGKALRGRGRGKMV